MSQVSSSNVDEKSSIQRHIQISVQLSAANWMRDDMNWKIQGKPRDELIEANHKLRSVRSQVNILATNIWADWYSSPHPQPISDPTVASSTNCWLFDLESRPSLHIKWECQWMLDDIVQGIETIILKHLQGYMTWTQPQTAHLLEKLERLISDCYVF